MNLCYLKYNPDYFCNGKHCFVLFILKVVSLDQQMANRLYYSGGCETCGDGGDVTSEAGPIVLVSRGPGPNCVSSPHCSSSYH